MADFPEHGSGKAGENAIGCLLVLGYMAVVIAWLVAVAFLIHGAITKDLWEVISGGVMVVVLMIIHQFGK